MGKKKQLEKVLCHKGRWLNEERRVQVFAITKAADEVLTSDAVTLLPSEATLGVCLNMVQ